MKKYSNDVIPTIVDLGDGSYEFCFNQTTETKKDDMSGKSHTGYVSDIVTIKGIPNNTDIITALIKDGKTEMEANELAIELTII